MREEEIADIEAKLAGRCVDILVEKGVFICSAVYDGWNGGRATSKSVFAVKDLISSVQESPFPPFETVWQFRSHGMYSSLVISNAVRNLRSHPFGMTTRCLRRCDTVSLPKGEFESLPLQREA
jgi:hypothetical protein